MAGLSLNRLSIGTFGAAALLGVAAFAQSPLKNAADKAAFFESKIRPLLLEKCSSCHGNLGQGGIGPNLTDDYWIHGSNFVDNLKTIWNGVPSKGMVTWKGVLKPNTIYSVGSYIYTLRGSHPKNPKPREDQAPKQTGPSEFE